MKYTFLLVNILLAGVLGTSAQVTYKFKTVDFPGSSFNRAHNINRLGDIVGLFSFPTGGGHGYLRHNGVFQQIDYPGAIFTSARGINSSLQIVGGYVDVNNVDHAFLLVNGQFTSFDVPGATSTDAFDIDDSGEIVGVCIDTAGVQHGFVLKDGIFSTLDFPRAATMAGCQGDLQISGSAKRRKPAYSADDRSAESVFGKERVTQIDAK